MFLVITPFMMEAMKVRRKALRLLDRKSAGQWWSALFCVYRIFRKRVMIPVLIKSANIAPMIGTMRKGLTA